MASRIKIKKGLDIPLMGEPQERFLGEVKSDLLKICPEDFTGVTPKLSVKVGDEVKAGEALMYDRNHPSVKVASPVSGIVTAIERGEKRRILNITVERKDENEFVDYGVKNALSMQPEEVKESILNAGLWFFIKQRPYDVVANPDKDPRDIFVTGFSSAPLAPSYDFILKDQEKDLQAGLDALSKLTKGKVYLSVSPKTKSDALRNAKNVVVTEFEGPHPAGNVGVQINHIAPVNSGEVVWTLNALDVAVIGRLFNTGKVDLTRLVALVGSEVTKKGYYKMLIGTSLNEVLKTIPKPDDSRLRYISGDPLTGRKIDENDVLRAYSSQITVIPEGNNTHEFFGWATLSPTKYSAGATYLSSLISKLNPNKRYRIDARLKGGRRAIIMSNEYDQVFPMNIYPEFLLKSIIAFDIDKMIHLGIFEVAPEDFALCEFVDTSKLEIQRIVRTGLDMLRKEVE
ncbi:MAG: Na(+)-translocating NADH-quinone reductase subunit A [Dysgonamonadaceae bacterium]|nr:Na(+)-translocating NADH-quinone reductase subunit A [Dysgonamonadaceae bacterium]MDD3355963.1 Na(+)-translocating NADH-quinone reductase subunit A [Dysgonamonadaceae bacterium]MDD3727480.1 Na(+)-translocating NADH-quinone reductase subunit A [Dysgonamonadaceae bacterium]MDD4246136.1 Na(+)-translocating NADH-quinone reductase subunit A [Dysgonamonadaceae bacterium]MDD4606127.1 Na(+)-translocating NADH-quinone reductase subunit A [Dysgonamonadaceae bacterium]